METSLKEKRQPESVQKHSDSKFAPLWPSVPTLDIDFEFSNWEHPFARSRERSTFNLFQEISIEARFDLKVLLYLNGFYFRDVMVEMCCFFHRIAMHFHEVNVVLSAYKIIFHRHHYYMQLSVHFRIKLFKSYRFFF